MNKEEKETQKALDFIKANAGVAPKKTRISAKWQIPPEIVDEIVAKVTEFDGSCAIPLQKFNKLFGWKETTTRSGYLTQKLNDQYAVEGKVWNVGTRNNRELYIFSLEEPEEE